MTRGASRVRCALLAAAVAVHAAPSVRAQERPEPQLLLTIFAGASTGGTLYSGLRQRLNRLEDPATIDTINLARRVTSGILVGASTTYFPSPNLGITAEISFLGLGRDDDCSMAYVASSPAPSLGYNEAVCGDIAATGAGVSTISFLLGGLYRVAARGAVKPYVRAQGGIALRNASTVELTGRFVDIDGVLRTRLVVEDRDPDSVEPTAAFGAGLMVPFAPGYQARLEFRDQLLFVNRLSGPADALAQAPTERTLMHSLGLVLTLDIVLEQKRGRRY